MTFKNLFSAAFMLILPFFSSQNLIEYDSSFGNNGKIFPFADTNSITKTLKTAEGKIIVIANSKIYKSNIDGSLDTSFGTNGSSSSITTSFPEIYDAALLSDGSIIVTYGNRVRSFIVKYTKEGFKDTSFNNNVGTLELSVDTSTNRSNYINFLKILSNDRIIVAGSLSNTTNSQTSIAVVKILSNGLYDTSFSIDGKQTFTYNAQNFINFDGCDIDSSNNIMILFSSFSGTDLTKNYLMKVSPVGSLVTTFGTNGYVTLSPSAQNVKGLDGSYLKLFGNNKMLIGSILSYTNSNNVDLQLFKLNADGSLDSSFGQNGRVTFDIDNNSEDKVSKILISSNENFYTLGSIKTNGIVYGFVNKHLANGSLDTNFNYNGIFTNNYISQRNSNFVDGFIENKKILLAGYTTAINTSVSYGSMIKIIDPDLILSSENLTKEKIQIYPNPSEEFITIKGGTKNSKIFIYDSTGHLILSDKYNGKMINIKSLIPGIYFLNTDKKVFRFIKK